MVQGLEIRTKVECCVHHTANQSHFCVCGERERERTYTGSSQPRSRVVRAQAILHMAKRELEIETPFSLQFRKMALVRVGSNDVVLSIV